MPGWLQAAMWGALAGSALLIGAVMGYEMRIAAASHRDSNGVRQRRSDIGAVI